MKTRYLIIALLAAVSCSNGPADGEHTLQLLTTNDVHGSWFDSTYVGGKIKNSLYAVNWCVDSVRTAAGADNVVLIDAGDCLQGDNAPYYFNYVDTTDAHLFPRLAAYMKYDAIAVGNHDIETGHHVYDRVTAELAANGIPWLGGNAIKTSDGKPYFSVYRMVKRAGLDVAIIGFTNPNMKEWLDESLWSGMTFESLLPLVQEDVDMVNKKEKPDVTIVMVHSGTGKGDGSIYESQGLDLYQSLHGVDFLVCSHDHAPRIEQSDSLCLINSGSHSRNIGHGTVTVTVKNHKVVSKTLSADLIRVNPQNVDTAMRDAFYPDFQKVKAFTLQEVGQLKSDLITRDAYTGMSDYMNLIHTLSLSCAPARLSFAAPLTFNGDIKAGTLIYNDLFTIYPYENQLFVVNMSGKEIKDYLEYSYDQWIQTPGDHALKIVARDDPRYGQKGWAFASRSYNFDSAAGISYTVDITKPYGERIEISSFAGGEPFSMDETYPVAMTSYRASGGGDLLEKGAGIDPDKIDERVVARYPEIRNILYNYLKDNGSIDPAITGDPARIGHWEFVPQPMAGRMISADMDLLFPAMPEMRH